MHPIDMAIFVCYFFALIGMGVYFLRRNRGMEDYYVGNRRMGPVHVGLSVVATDVGGGFSIGLGGLGFTMGISGSWLLFTGLLGALLSGTFLIPHLHRNRVFAHAMTFPDLFRTHYGPLAAIIAAVISAVGYLGFTSSQILAGTKLATATFPFLDPTTTLLLMGGVAVVYTVLGGIKAVIYTDTVQWTILLLGLTFVGVPYCLASIGGLEVLLDTLPADMLSLGSITWQRALSWAVTIIPIWFVGMTLYQRIFACRDEQTARRAWYIAGFFEWPVMAFLGVFMGMIARAAVIKGLLPMELSSGVEMDPEQGLPRMLATMLPVGVMGLMLSAYFSAILSTADSCLMAASGNTVSDLLIRLFPRPQTDSQQLRWSRLATLVLGVLAILLATTMTSVLDLMLLSYAFMVSGLFVPVLGCLLLKKHSSVAAVAAMVTGGTITVILTALSISPLGLDPNVFGIAGSVVAFAAGTRFSSRALRKSTSG